MNFGWYKVLQPSANRWSLPAAKCRVQTPRSQTGTMLLSVLVLILLAAAVQPGSSPLSGAELTRLYNSPVYQAERMRRPKGSSSSAVGPFSHSGVRLVPSWSEASDELHAVTAASCPE